jgi:hypothetical protein
MASETIRNEILDSLTELKNKNDNSVIPILKKELKFESSKYSSTKENIWHVFLNGNKIKKTSDYLFTSECLSCHNLNTCASTQFLRKIRPAKSQCFQCNNISLNETEYDRTPKTKVEKEEKTYRQKYEDSLIEFESYPDQYKNSYLLSHLSTEDYARIKPKIISFGNGKFIDLYNYEYWSIYKVNNQMKFSYVIYDKVKDMIFKANQPIMKCDNCENNWRCKSLESFKNNYKILCKDCILCNRTFKIKPIKNINNQVIMYQSKLELKFIEWCASNNLVVNNGPNVDYVFHNKERKYKVDFQIDNILIEIKDFHIWHRNQVESGLWDEKVKAVNQFILDNKLRKYYFITPNNWNQMIKELCSELKV